jgi:hypothetical protein
VGVAISGDVKTGLVVVDERLFGNFRGFASQTALHLLEIPFVKLRAMQADEWLAIGYSQQHQAPAERKREIVANGFSQWGWDIAEFAPPKMFI